MGVALVVVASVWALSAGMAGVLAAKSAQRDRELAAREENIELVLCMVVALSESSPSAEIDEDWICKQFNFSPPHTRAVLVELVRRGHLTVTERNGAALYSARRPEAKKEDE